MGEDIEIEMRLDEKIKSVQNRKCSDRREKMLPLSFRGPGVTCTLPGRLTKDSEVKIKGLQNRAAGVATVKEGRTEAAPRCALCAAKNPSMTRRVARRIKFK